MSEEKSWKYRIVYERAAGVGKTDGFKVEANGDDMVAVKWDAHALYLEAIDGVKANYPQLPEVKKEVK